MMSAVWKYFRVNASDKNKADCNLCMAKLSRGGTKSTGYNTSNLIKHLKSQHEAEYKEFTCDNKRQPTLQQMLAKRKKMSRDKPRVVKITEALAEYIALDDQPLSVVDNVGFQSLLCILEPRYEIPSCTHITDTVLLKLRNFVKKTHLQPVA